MCYREPAWASSDLYDGSSANEPHVGEPRATWTAPLSPPRLANMWPKETAYDETIFLSDKCASASPALSLALAVMNMIRAVYDIPIQHLQTNARIQCNLSRSLPPAIPFSLYASLRCRSLPSPACRRFSGSSSPKGKHLHARFAFACFH
jgi:hypothetical protein